MAAQRFYLFLIVVAFIAAMLFVYGYPMFKWVCQKYRKNRKNKNRRKKIIKNRKKK